ncbi:uncharacterized protein LOC114262247 [Camellia sinensis]|uniref:uncharacterized protein LOC114262247 n=1 Tax=Camellia sinensis TaxID=4442 RepID=UPI001035CD45|nr:uncharacterized protein LOC114262247 [Camellia sinensis]
MTLLIDGPSSPGNNIDVYLHLVVDELKELWENGVDTDDVETNQMFRMHAVLLWTINDFPAYAILSGWSTKGTLACPCCNTHTQSRYLKNGRKLCYMGHRRWLNRGHNFRKASVSFDGTREFEPCPTRLSGANTVLNVDGKGKDNLNTHRDLQDMRIRKALHPQKRVGNKYYLPPACFAMNNREKSLFCTLLKNIKVLDGYASNISRWVNLKQRSISGLKSHDNHILMKLCFKTLDVDGLNCLQSQIALTLCHLERIVPPSFFDIMEHLPILLAEEAKIAGPVQYRWMYFVERYFMALKSYMRNRSHPEGSIAKGYLMEECMSFCSRNYDVSDNPGILLGHALGKGKGFALDNTSWEQAHQEYRDFIKQSHRRLKDFDVDCRHNDEFPRWFNSRVEEFLATENAVLSDEIKTLALGPSNKATRFSGYIINGTRYHTRSCEWKRKTQNSRVMVKAKTCSYASTRDMNPVEGEVAYYGYVTDIIELYYSYDRRYLLFMCDWIDNNKGLKQMKPRDLYEVCGEQPINDGVYHSEVEGFGDQELDATSFACEEDINWVRQGEFGTTIDEVVGPLEISTQTQSEDDEEIL